MDTGSRDEAPSESGISHFIEHMVFKGTKTRSVRKIAQSIESVGGYLNAFTGKEHTCFYARVLDDHAELAVDVLSDMLRNPTFPEKELEKEKEVVIEELKNAEDDPDDIIHDYLEKSLFGEHPLGNAVIGKQEDLRSFKRADLYRYLGSHYQSSRIVVAAAGRLGHRQLVDLVGRYWGEDREPSAGLPGERVKPKAAEGETRDLERPIQQSHVCLGTIAVGARSNRRYPMLLLNALLGDGMSSRLFQNIREKYGFAYSVYSFVNMLSDTGTFGAYIGTDKTHVEKCVELIWKELLRLRTRSIPRAEVERTKQQLKGSMMLSLESIPSRMMRLGSSELYYGSLTSLEDIIRKIDAVTEDDLLALANDIVDEKKYSMIVFRPDGRN